MLRMYLIVLSVLATFGFTSVFVASNIGLRAASTVAVLGLLVSVATIFFVSVDKT